MPCGSSFWLCDLILRTVICQVFHHKYSYYRWKSTSGNHKGLNGKYILEKNW